MINMLFNQSQEPAFQENADVILNGGVKWVCYKEILTKISSCKKGKILSLIC